MLWFTGVKDEKGFDIAITLEEAPSYLTEEFYICYFVFCNSHDQNGNRHYPFSGGWAEQPWWIIQVLNILEQEEYKIQQEKEADNKDRQELKNMKKGR